MSRPSFKLILLLVAQFVLGGLCGVILATRPWFIKGVQTRAEERWIATRWREDRTRLKFTPEQESRVRPTYDKMLADVRRMHEATRENLIEIARTQARSLWPELTPEQQQEFTRLSEERKARLVQTTKP